MSLSAIKRQYISRFFEINSYKDCLLSPLPHFQEAEKLIFCEWLRDKNAYGEYGFDIPLPPEDIKTRGGLIDAIVKQASYLLALKVDALKVEGEDVILIEVKRRALASGIGQLLTYKNRLEKLYPGVRVKKMIYVVPLASRDIKDAAADLGIEVHEVPWLALLGMRYVIGLRKE